MTSILPPTPICKLIGHQNAVDAIKHAKLQNRCPHAVLISGKSGIGKARMALEIAEQFLSGRESIRAGSHPDFRWIGRSDKTSIPVDSIRNLARFLARKSSFLKGYKLAVIDSLDEMNRFGLNALLKTLEEPQGLTLLLLVWHRKCPIPATIASRCMQLRLSTLNNAQTQQVLAHMQQPQQNADIAPGQPGLIQRMSLQMNTRNAATRSLQEGTSLSAKTLATLVSANSPDALEAAGRIFCQHAQTAAANSAKPANSGIWASAYISISRLLAEQQEFMLEPGQTISSILREISRAQRMTNEAV